MADLVAPSPIGADANSFVWQEWYNQLTRLVNALSRSGVDITSNQTISGQKTFSAPVKITIPTGTAPLVISSTTNVVNLNASSLNGATFAAPGAIGGTTPANITGVTILGTTLQATNGFGCNGKTPQTSVASGGALAAYAAGANGLSTGAAMQALVNQVNAIRTALVANGIMS